MPSTDQINAIAQLQPIQLFALAVLFIAAGIAAGLYFGNRGKSKMNEGQADIFKANAQLITNMSKTLESHLEQQRKQDDLRDAEIALRINEREEVTKAFGAQTEALTKMTERVFAQNLLSEKIESDIGQANTIFKQAHADTRQIIIEAMTKEFASLLVAIREPQTLTPETVLEIARTLTSTIKAQKDVLHDSQNLPPVDPTPTVSVTVIADSFDTGARGDSQPLSAGNGTGSGSSSTD